MHKEIYELGEIFPLSGVGSSIHKEKMVTELGDRPKIWKIQLRARRCEAVCFINDYKVKVHTILLNLLHWLFHSPCI